MKKICVVTGTRAEFGLLKLLITKLQKSDKVDLQLCVTGAHLATEFGLTYREIESEGFFINSKIEIILSSDTPTGVSKSMGLGLIGFSQEFERLQPDLIILLGDRYEIIVAAIAATVARVPIAHIHGGEITEGAIDDAFRHSITKMSHLHFVATDEYKKRVIQLGENPEFVYNVGGLGVDVIRNTKFLSKKQLEEKLNIKFWRRNILVTFHPETLEEKSTINHMIELLNALNRYDDTKIIFTMPNADTGGRIFMKLIHEFNSKNSNSVVFSSLGILNYLSVLRIVNMVVGNSSSGLLEVPSFNIPTINIGDRQKGRTKPLSVIDCKPNMQSIVSAIKKGLSNDFNERIKNVVNPYGDGGSSKKIFEVISKIKLNKLRNKSFIDVSSIL